jgi:pimeloyl-ACP methyl ester carboxylesterase
MLPVPPPSRSEFLRVRGLRYHVRRWGRPDRPALYLGTGWLDVSASFGPLVAGLLDRFQVLAPDWRGLGHSQWPEDGYWFHDYVADLDALLQHYSPDTPVALIGHSMGAQIMSLYAGLRPERVSRLALLDGLFLPDMDAAQAPKRFRGWLDALRDPPRHQTYDSFEELARRVQKQHPQLDADKALFVACCWGQADGFGRIRLLADPRHRLRGPGLYRSAESMAIWRQITAPTLFVDAGRSLFANAIGAEERAARRDCFRERQEVRIENAGHMLHFDEPEATARHLHDFFCA